MLSSNRHHCDCRWHGLARITDVQSQLPSTASSHHTDLWSHPIRARPAWHFRETEVSTGLSALPRVLCPTKQQHHRLKLLTTAGYVSLIENVILSAFADLRIATINFVTSVHPHRITSSHRPDYHEIRSFEYFYKICQKICLIKIWQEYRVLYMKTYVHFWSRWVLFRIRNLSEKIKTHIYVW